MESLSFTPWDAPGFGSPLVQQVSSTWRDQQLVSITLGRSQGADSNDLPDIATSTLSPEFDGSGLEGLILKALLEFVPRLTSLSGMSAREGADVAVRLAEGPGAPATLTLATKVVDAVRYEVPVTGDWVVAAADRLYRTCVAGKSGFDVPALAAAEMELWDQAIAQQIAEILSGD